MFIALYNRRKPMLMSNIDLSKASCHFICYLCSDNDDPNSVPGDLEHAVDERHGKWLW